ncbi:hypothetical protein VBG40_02000 [Vagococcus fluvialis]|uniref:hypothetical protein n=1 Tax=Vagococcus fluvialis TaxID=2738 RepID=UPI0037A99D71
MGSTPKMRQRFPHYPPLTKNYLYIFGIDPIHQFKSINILVEFLEWGSVIIGIDLMEMELIWKVIDWLVKNIWENESLVNWLSAIGTIGAVWVSLWLAREKKSNKRITGMLFDYDIWKSSGTEYQDEAIYYQESTHLDGYIQIYNPTEENKYLYDIKIYAYFDHKGLLKKEISDFYNKEYNKINHFKIQPKDAVVEGLNIVFHREKSREKEQREFLIKAIDLVGKNESQQNIVINIYKKPT